MTELSDTRTWPGRDVVGSDGVRIGRLEDVYVDAESDEAQFLLVSGGLFGRRRHFVPVSGAGLAGDDVAVPYAKDVIQNAPGVEADEELSRDEEAALFRYYDELDVPSVSKGEQVADERQEDDASSAGDEAMTRSEEELRVVGTRARPRARVRLRKQRVTEYVTMRVPVTREEVRMEQEPVADSSEPDVDATDGDDDAPEESGEAVTLMTEEPVVEKRSVPKERVRLQKETVTEQRQISEPVRKERVRVEGDDAVLGDARVDRSEEER